MKSKRIICAVLAVVLIFGAAGAAIYGIFFRERFTAEPEMIENGISFPLDYPWSSGLDVAWGMPMVFSIADDSLAGMEVTWEISSEEGTGTFFLDNDAVRDQATEDTPWLALAYLGNSFHVETDTLIRWVDWSTSDPEGFTDLTLYKDESTYVDAIARADGHIIGYAVIEIVGVLSPLDVDKKYGIAAFEPHLIGANYYPMVDGEFQDVTEEYVAWKIRQAKFFS